MKWWQIVIGVVAIGGMALAVSCCGGGGVRVAVDQGPPPAVVDQGPGEHPATHLILDPGAGRACRSELFLIDVPFDQPLPGSHASNSTKVRLALEMHLATVEGGQTVAERWLASTCSGAPVKVALDDVFADSPQLLEPDHQLRHQVLSFYCDADKEAKLAVKGSGQCQLLRWVEETFRDLGGPVEVARDCDARGQQSPGDWYKASVGSFPGSASHPVRLAVADAPAGDDHAKRVLALATEMSGAPQSGLTIEAVKVLDSAPGTPTSRIASRLGSWIDSLPTGGTPIVLNMSFGWPPEMGSYANIRDRQGDCNIREAPVGRAVATALAAFKRKHPKSLAFAAIGNRSQVVDYPQGVIDGFGSCGPTNNANGPLPFFPASWAWPHEQDDNPCKIVNQALTIAVGSHGIEDTEGNIGISDPQFYAPGRQLSIPTTPPEPGTGTSYATAIASGAAARALMSTSPAENIDYQWFLDTHTCKAPGASFARLRISGNTPCRQPGMASPPAPSSPCPPGGGCVSLSTDPMTSGQPNLLLAPSDSTGFDVYSLGLASPQPIEPICPGGPCYVFRHNPGDIKMTLIAEIDSRIVQAPGVPHVSSPTLLIDFNGERFSYPIKETLIGGKTYYLSGFNLPSAVVAQPYYLKYATFSLGYKLTDSGSTAWREDALDLYP